MRYEMMGTRLGSFRDAEGDTWYEVDGGVDMGSFDADNDAEARQIAVQSFDGHEIDENDVRSKIVGRGEPDFVAAFVTDDEAPPYIVRRVN